jgi:sugar/nucleoside kinase (ribokinase family)
MFAQLDLVALNEEETIEFVGDGNTVSTPEQFVERLSFLLSSTYPQLRVIMSVGKDGAYFVDRTGWGYSPAPKVNVASTAGAGDCLLGGILAAMAAGISLPNPQRQTSTTPMLANALDFGVLLASYKVSSPHTIHPSASLDELLRFTQQLEIPIGLAVQQLVAEKQIVEVTR